MTKDLNSAVNMMITNHNEEDRVGSEEAVRADVLCPVAAKGFTLS